MTVRELIERLGEYKPATNVLISTDPDDPINDAEPIRGMGEIKGFDEADGIYLLAW